ncbi:Aminopeptidase N-like 10 [Homarus americanus]|uniref:Aminopeptidase N-like 10 n=1 Tax=Homarus americanus TaxID=6706 RepID=A0A8J5N7Y9_HOMAM|nr:Aminopeptidase N-like 10 [Homarus americanus]
MFRSISPNLKSTVYCTGIAQGGEVEWEAAWSRYLTSNTPAEKTQLLAALGCTKHTGILSRYLDMAFTEGSGIRKADSILVLNAVAENDVGHSLAWHYLTRRWQYITSYYALQQALESTNHNIAWINNNYDVIVRWLHDNGYKEVY